eukprot:4333068-Prymnesium_polylepis.1
MLRMHCVHRAYLCFRHRAVCASVSCLRAVHGGSSGGALTLDRYAGMPTEVRNKLTDKVADLDWAD